MNESTAESHDDGWPSFFQWFALVKTSTREVFLFAARIGAYTPKVAPR
ncbi:hypothetical protein [Polaromonas jejuensis]|uniref:Uncharacterized protein n=1 Tax=Polaromonas jejuensis TaxID=457502 RepID=A0ABW0Q836_9BURK|nr:hypothetical protein [Polaromonas jejuensis]